MLRYLGTGLVILLLITRIGSASAGKLRFIAIGTGGPVGVYYTAGNAICNLLLKSTEENPDAGQKGGIHCSAPPTGGSKYNISQIAKGVMDFGITQSDWQYHAYNGSTLPKIEPFKALRTVFSIYPEPFLVVVSKTSNIERFVDLKNKRVNIGNVGSGQRETMKTLMDAYDIAVEDFEAATEWTLTEVSQALCDDRIDAYVALIGVPSDNVAAAVENCGARIISLDTEVEKKLVTENAYYSFTTIPKGTYPSMTRDVVTFNAMATLVTRASVEEEIVYELVRVVMSNLDNLRRVHPVFADLDPRKMIEGNFSAPLHPGAIRYYKEMGWM
ncbi:MAG: TAXI family TRAP transporter solute-binding subunit [Gammaproteobacteria bacterium]|nr:TAXI family TRAP transporter solute-binding subunit [Gammaproteobacteria bacterium]